MKYMGSKARHAKEILPIILKDRKPGQWYVEPFVGGANVIDKVDGNRIGSDSHQYLIELWRAVSQGWIPPEHVSESDYHNCSKVRDVNPYTAFVGFGCSYSGKWFGGYARGGDNFGNPRNYASESARNIIKQAKNIRGVQFIHSPYLELEIPNDSIVYCDPPYAGTTKYATGSFDHNQFWAWCDKRVGDGQKVFVSEYNAPPHWICVWEKKVNNTLTKDTGSKQGVERLFVHESQA